MKKIRHIILFLLLVFPSASPAWWPVFRGNFRHNGKSDYEGPSNPRIKWVFEGAGIYNLHSPLIGKDGTIFVQKGTGDYMRGNDAIYALKPDGNMKWKYSRPELLFSPPALSPDGTLYAVATKAAITQGEKNDSYLLAIDAATGKLKREMYMSEHFTETWMSHIAADSSGRVYVRGGDVLSAYMPDGERLWSYRTLMGADYGYAEHSSGPTLSPDEKTIYFLKRVGGGLLALDAATGKIKWTKDIEFYTDYSSPVVAPDGVLYVPDMATKTLYALSPSGEVRWKAILEGKHNNSFPTAGANGTLYYTTEEVKQEDGGTVFALDEKNGNVKWRYKIKKGYIASPPTIDKNGLIYLGSGDGYLHCLTPDGNLKWKIKVGLDIPDLDQIYMSEPVLNGKTIYIVSGPLAKWARLVAVGQE